MGLAIACCLDCTFFDILEFVMDLAIAFWVGVWEWFLRGGVEFPAGVTVDALVMVMSLSTTEVPVHFSFDLEGVLVKIGASFMAFWD